MYVYDHVKKHAYTEYATLVYDHAKKHAYTEYACYGQ